MRKTTFLFLSISLLIASCTFNTNKKIANFTTDSLEITINDRGNISSLVDLKSGKNYVIKDSLAPLMSIRVGKEIIKPTSASYENNIISLSYDQDVTAEITIEEKSTHCVFELTSLSNKDKVELIVWGPYPIAINKIISETVGVVRNDEFAIGIQSLNIKTLGGYPWYESDRMPDLEFFTNNDHTDMNPQLYDSISYRIEAARPINNGSSLQAYCRDRSKERIYSDLNHDKIVAPPYHDGGVVGSKIALFGSEETHTLETIGKIEVAEGLPHPMIDGEWVKTNRDAGAAYLITSFTEGSVDKAIALTKKAGLKYLYHNGKTFESWGTFEPAKEEFPSGIAGMKACVDKAAAEGIRMGTHCLSNFIQTNDPYITPIPDKRLAKVGSSVLTEDINATDRTITIESPDYFNQMKNNNLKTVMIGEELIRYDRVSTSSPWQLLDCQRGAYDTKAASHQSGEKISKLLDHGYKVFLTEAELTIELAKNLAELYNKTGLRQISFDGLEGNRSTGLGTYGESLMPYTWYNNLTDDMKKDLIIDASRTTHFFWHIYSRMNWGEPWYAGFRESQTAYRFNNQAYFQRNFMPGMLGWFRMTPETTVEDIEWMLAKSAGYDAGYALVADLETVENNGNSDQIFSLVGDWEKLRLSNSFSEDQKSVMRDNDKEFSISKINEDSWKWQEVHGEIYAHKKKVRQPGEPLYSSFKYTNSGERQTMNFSLSPQNCNVSGITLEINNYKKIALPGIIKEGETLKYIGNGQLILYTAQWDIVKEYKISPDDLMLNTGENTIVVDCTFDQADTEANLKLEVRTIANEEIVNWNREKTMVQ